ncbi:MAG: GDP-mannose 4,6-dehydratase, partial [Phycisphaerales bacterium]|nr:GDP-mannose 4,6-dehydratase [Phycisphaerales bacterium]
VTGGAGFIGSHLVEALLQRGDEVTVIDNLSTGRRENLPARHARLRFIEGDLGAVLPGVDAGERFAEIYHLAAAVGVRRILERPVESIETNIVETVALLRFAEAHGPGSATGARTLIASSSEVYGKSEAAPFAEADDCVYGPTTASRWSYACSKAIDEHLALAHATHAGLPVVIARFFNTVGPRQVGDYGMVLPNFVRAALAGDALPVYGDGGQSRCFCDVRDVVPAITRLLATPACLGRVFNLGSDQLVTIGDLARLVIDTLGSTSTVERIPYERAYGPGFEDLRLRRPDLTRIREAIGFRAAIPLEQTIRDIAAQMGNSHQASPRNLVQ